MKDKRIKRELGFYVLMLLVGIGVVLYISRLSESQTPISDVSTTTRSFMEGVVHNFNTFTGFISDHIVSHFGLLLLQIIIILLAARLVAWGFTKIGQPSVIGEIIAGIILGPSVFGLIYPAGFEFLFPQESLYNISLLSQFGLILFMFVIGMELDLSQIKKNLKKAFIISHAGIIFPFILGAILAVFLFDDYAGDRSAILPFALFVGVSMSVTAFPVLARIIQEQGKMQTRLGMLSMASAANGDITAWCIVAVIVAIAQAGSAASAIFTVIAAILYMLLMFFIVRPAFRVVGNVYNTTETANKGLIAMVFLTLLISSYLTEVLGLHALFGAFIAGVVMPDNINFRHVLTEKVEDVSLALFLPLFFVSSGLQTEIGLLNTSVHWMITGVITLVAIFGKVGGTYIACRVVGEERRDSLYMGILMNTRGLMELIILSMGYQFGILSPVAYAMLVIMTLVTTFMTTPTLELMEKIWPKIKTGISNTFNVLFSFGRSRTGKVMLNLIQTFFGERKEAVDVIGMHMTIGETASFSDAELFRRSNFEPIEQYAGEMGMKIKEHYEITENATASIIRASEDLYSDLLLVGAGLDLSSLPEDIELNKKHNDFKSLFRVSFSKASGIFNIAQFFKNKTEIFVNDAPCSVGIVVNRGLKTPAQSILAVDSPSDTSYTKLLDFLTNGISEDSELKRLNDKEISDYSAEQFSANDLLILPYNLWKEIVEINPEFIAMVPTTLLLHARMDSEKSIK